MAFGIVAASVVQLVGEYLFSQHVREQERVCAELAARIAAPHSEYDSMLMFEIARDATLSGEARVIVLDLNGCVQVDSESALNGTRYHIKQVADVLAGAEASYGYYQSRRAGGLFGLSASAGAMTGIFACEIRSGGARTGALIYISAAQDIYEGLSQISTQILITLVAVFMVIGVLSVCIVRLFTRPIRELNTGISLMAKGDFTARVRVRGKNEFAELANAFNSMCQRMEALDRSRNQFVSNASHELKTPLSTMKILLETILYQGEFDPALTREFLSDIDKEIDRLSYVVGDLLTLVNIDSGEMHLNVAPLKLKELIGETVRKLAPLARERGIELDFIAREPVDIMGDDMKLTQVYYNLIDNAIKYTPRGGHVRVELIKQGKQAVTRVADDGIGIPKDDQMHIFDRFYRVDKARSRETGGTGLGLSIVKQIVLLHEGEIMVKSQENVGTLFTVKLPVMQKSPAPKLPAGGRPA